MVYATVTLWNQTFFPTGELVAYVISASYLPRGYVFKITISSLTTDTG